MVRGVGCDGYENYVCVIAHCVQIVCVDVDMCGCMWMCAMSSEMRA